MTIQAQILDLLRQLKDKINSSIMLITHDLGVIAEMADYVVVMYAGRVVEKGTVQEIFDNPAHPYTIGLMASKPVVGKKVDKLYSIPGKVPNPVNMPEYCYFKDRCEHVHQALQRRVSGGNQPVGYRIKSAVTVTMEEGGKLMAEKIINDFEPVKYDPQYILMVNHLKKYFPIKGGMMSRNVGYVKAVDGVTFNLKRGTTMGLVGESGCGKTTTGRTILRLSGDKTGGQVLFNGKEVYDLQPKELRALRTKMQIIFQDPFSSFVSPSSGRRDHWRSCP